MPALPKASLDARLAGGVFLFYLFLALLLFLVLLFWRLASIRIAFIKNTFVLERAKYESMDGDLNLIFHSRDSISVALM